MTFAFLVHTARSAQSDLQSLVREAHLLGQTYSARVLATHFGATLACDALPIIPAHPLPLRDSAVDAGSVIDLVLSNMPVPDESTSWESIIDFRSDDEARKARNRLRRWMHKFASAKSSVREVNDELEYLLDEYRSYMRLHRIKTQHSKLETVLTVSAEALENLVTFHLSNAVKALFSWRKEKIALLEAEQAAPGRDIAYIVMAQDRFGGGA